MAFITNATRKVVIDHVVATLGRAPTTKELADVTVLLNDGASLADVAGYLTSSAAYLSKYPVGQTASEAAADILDAAIAGGVLAADIRLAVIDLIAGGLTAGTYTIATATNAVVAYLSDTANNDNADLGDIAKAFQNRTAAAEEFTTTFTLEGVTVTEADLAAAVEGVTSDAATLTAAKAAFEAGNKSIATQAAADKAAADAAAAKAAEEKAAADKAAADAAAAKAAEEKAAADAAAAKAAEEKATADAAAAKAAEEKAAADAEQALVDAATEAAAAAVAAITAAEEADAELATAKTASEAAAETAAETDAEALAAELETATEADTAAKEALEAATKAYNDAITAADAAAVVTAQGEKIIAQNKADKAAAALVEATDASEAATAADEAAAEALAAYETALEAANEAAEAAETAAAAAVTAAAATADTDDDTAAAAQVTEAAAATPTATEIADAAAEAKAAEDKAAADKAAAEEKAAADKAAADAEAEDVAASTAAAEAANQAIADSATANAEAEAANAAIVDNTTSAAAVVKADAAVAAAAAATTAVNAYVTAAAATDDDADDTAAAALVTTAAEQSTAASALSETANAEAAIDRAAQSFTLTTGVDQFTGGMGPDTFDASQANSLNTLTSGDRLEGGEGADTLYATLGATTLSVNTSDIETLALTATGAVTLNASASTGIEEIASNASTAALTINGLNSVPSLTLNSNSNATTLSFNNSALASASDSITINLEGVTDGAGAGTGDITLSRSAGATNDLESVTVNSSVVANSIETLNVGGVDTATLNVTGNQNLTITDALDTDISTVNASSFTGALNVTLSATTTSLTGGSGADDVTRGSLLDSLDMGDGNDIIRTSDVNFDKTSSIAGGDGTDSLVAVGDTTVIDTDFTLVSSVETLTAVANDQLTVTLGAKAAASGLETVTMADATAADSVTVGSAFTNDLTVNLSADGAVNVVDATNYTKALTVSGKISTMDDNAPTVTGGKGTSDSLVIRIDESDDALLTGLSAVEQITVVDAAAASNHTTSVNLDDNNATYTSALVYDTLTVDATAIGASGDTVNIDASAESDAKVILKGGDGVNTIRLSASTNFGDTVTAGAGKDNITFATADLTKADIIDGGDDSDTLVSVDDATVVDADFTNVTNVEAISGTATKDLDLTLGSLADAAGIRTVTFTDEGSVGDTVTIGKTFTSAITVVLDDHETAKNVVDASAYVGSGLTVRAAISDLVDAGGVNSDITGSANTNDNYNIVIDAAGGTMATPTGLTNVETITVTDGVAATNSTGTIVLADQNATYTNSATYQTITVDATAIGAAGDTVNIDASAEQDAKVVINAGDGVNTITLSTSANFGDTVTAGGGKDIIIANATNLTAADVIDGGDGADTLKVNADATLLDAAFTGVTSVESLTGTVATIAINATLGALAQASGLATILLSDNAAAETITVGAGFTSALRIDLDDDANGVNTVSATKYTGNLTVTALASEMDTKTHVLTGGTGSDTLQVTSAGDDDTLIISSLTNFETITLVDDGDATADTLTLSVADASVASGATLTIDGSGLLVDDITVDLSSETNGVNVVKGGAGVDLITASASTSGDNLQGNAGNDVFSFATKNFTSADTVDGGAGDDTIKMTNAATVIDADFTNVTSVKTLTYTNAGDNQSFTVGALAAAAGISVITTGSGTNTVTFAANNGATTVNLAAGTDTVNAAAATEAVTVVIAETSLTNADTLTGGTGSDILSLTSDAGTGNFTGVSGFETLKTTANNATGITTVDGNVADGGSLTVNALSLTTAVLTFDGSAELDGSFAITAGGTGDHQITLGQGNDSYTSTSTAGEDVTATAGNNTIRTGDGDDVIVGGSGDDTMYGEAGADTFKFASANFTSADTVSGGTGNDTIEMTDDSIVTDSDFTNVTSVKTLTATAAKNLTATLGANAAAAGISAVTLVDDGAANTVTLSAGFTSAVNVTLSTDANAGDVVNATAYTGALTVTATDENLDSTASTLTGGSGTNTLAITLTADNTLLLDSVSGFDTITLTGDDNQSDTATITLADAVVAKGETLTITGSGLNQANNDAKLVFDGSAESNGSFIITTAGDQAHTITLGQGADTYTGSGSGNTSVTGTAGANTITTGTGADTITAGSGADTMTGGTGNDIFAFGSAANASGDSITDFVSADDQIGITLDYSALLSGVVVNGVRTSTGVAGTSAAEATFTGQRGEYVYDTTSSTLIVNANADASVSGADFQIGVNAATTAKNTIAAGDVNFTVTGTDFADTILTGAGADTINGGAGVDRITGGAGSDAISPGAGADIVVYSATTDAGTAGSLLASAGDAIDNTWVQGTDKLAFVGDFLTAEMTGTAASAVNAVANAAGVDFNGAGSGDDVVQIIAGNAGNTALVADLLTLADLNAALGAITNEAIGDERILIFNAATDAKAAIYLYTGVAADGALAANELQLIGIVDDNAIAAGDIQFT